MLCKSHKLKAESLKVQLQQQTAVLDSFSKSMAIIEFDPQGIVLTANDNFLKLMGYRLEEIKGKHHRLFVDDVYAKSKEYSEFWLNLKNGLFNRSTFKRIGKSGEVVWIEASYNPVFDENGNILKFVKIASDVSEKMLKSLDDRGQIDALNRIMAIIEFDLSGNIIKANDNFCKAMGYDFSEIKGKHHRIFVKPEYAQSAEYRQFWDSLASGKSFSGSYTREGKNGKKVIIEASYNAILDDEGKPYKVVKYATDIGNNTNMKLLTSAVSFISDTMKACSNGQLDALGDVDHSAYQSSPFYEMVSMLNDTIYCTTDRLQHKVAEAIHIAQVVNEVANSVSATSSEVSIRIFQQVEALESSVSNINEVAQTVEVNTDNALKVSKLAMSVSEESVEGSKVMDKTIEAMSLIEESSRRITEIVGIVDSIAFQTNLLALNAAVEAARAGEHGRGFAVVASEVRALAGKSADAAKDIKSLIAQSIERIGTGSKLARQSGDKLQSINVSVQDVVTMINAIANASKEQSDQIQEITKSLNHIDAVMHENNTLVEESNHASNELKQQADQLITSMSYFKVKKSILEQTNSN